jgi:two-component system, OmpR family, sensor histidine kinase KdpD
MSRGTLRIYLGAAPGVGKTFAMLGEGRRRRERGTDVVVGFVEFHGRPRTAEQVGDLEVVPRMPMEYRGAAFEEMDVDAVLRRRPQVALVDELAHTNVVGSHHAKRFEDVEELLAAGIHVVSTLNIQHLESLNDVVESITGVRQRETVPDAVVRAADQIELVDMTPEALRRRMAHGNVYAPEKVDAALGHYFRLGNLAALRELALLWVADRVEEALQEYRVHHGIERPWETKERVVVALAGAPGGEHLVRRAARMAARARAELIGVHVRADDGLAAPPTERLEAQRRLLDELGGDFREVVGPEVGRALVELARAENATQIVLGASRRSWWAELTRGSVVGTVLRESGPIDVHVISTQPEPPEAPLPRRPERAVLPRRRVLLGFALAAAGAPGLTLVLAQLRGHVGLPSVLLLYLLLVVTVSALGGAWPAVTAAVASFLLANWFFTPPVNTWTVAHAENVLALAVFLVVAGVVSSSVGLSRRRALEAARARAEAETLARLAGASVEDDPLPGMLESLRVALGLDGAAVLSRTGDGWTAEHSTGSPPPARPEAASVAEELEPGRVLVLSGPDLDADDLRVLRAFTAQLSGALQRRRLRVEAGTAEALSRANELRTALLAAVSHDLRTPISSIKASATSLLQDDVTWPAEEVRAFALAIDTETDRLNRLVGNLLDMSRLATGALEVLQRPVGLEEVVPAALASLGERASEVLVEVPETLPRVLVDPALLERAVANVVANALNWSPSGAPVRIEAGAVAGRVDLRVADRGPGISEAHRERVFQPFQRLGDSGRSDGVGLGLAVAKGFVEAMGGEVGVEDTPGGGTTMVLSLRTDP